MSTRLPGQGAPRRVLWVPQLLPAGVTPDTALCPLGWGRLHSQGWCRGGRAVLLVLLHTDVPGLRPTSRPGPRPGLGPQLGGLPGSLVCSVRFIDCFLKTSKLVLFAH